MKLYCYVDETGQDTQGRLFVVGVVILGNDRAAVIDTCSNIAKTTNRTNKWSRSSDLLNITYMTHVLKIPELVGRLYFDIYKDTGVDDYLHSTIRTIAAAIALQETGETEECKATILFDGLPKNSQAIVGATLKKQYGVRVDKVRGVRHEDSDELIKLADAVCGLVRDATDGKNKKAARRLFENGINRGVLIDIRGP